MVTIGVFDSGIGGKAIIPNIRQLLPDADILYADDHANMPYGSKPASEIRRLTAAAVLPLITAKCDVIIIACNTATTTAIHHLRATYPTQRFIGIEPMLKPASRLTKTGVIAVFATPGTLTSDRYAALKHEWTDGARVLEPDCREWASLIESGAAETIDVASTVQEAIKQHADVIVLGCTHYHWLKDRVKAAAGTSVTVLEPSDAIGSRLLSIVQSDSTAVMN